MEHVKNFEKRIGCDLGYHKNIHPKDGEGCVGKGGINKSYTLQQVIDLAYRMEEKPNIIIKAGINAKWYLKKFTPDIIEEERAYFSFLFLIKIEPLLGSETLFPNLKNFSIEDKIVFPREGEEKE